MGVSIKVLPKFGLLFVKFFDHVKAAEAVDAFKSYLSHPDYAPGQKHLVDFSAVTSFEGDYTKLMELQASMVETVMHDQQVLFVYCAPTRLTEEMAQHSVTAWTGISKVVVRVLKTEQEALDVVGLAGESFSGLLQTA